MTTLTATLLPTGGADAAADGDRVLVVLASLGTGVQPLWQDAAAQLPEGWTVVGVDLPGHGRSTPLAARAGIAVTIQELAEQVLGAVRAALPGAGSFAVAGDSVGGAIALQLALSYPEAVEAAGVFCSGAKIGTAEAWEERAAFVEEAGTPSMVEGSVQRWFAPGFVEAQPAVSTELLHSLRGTDRFSYAAVCRALAAFDVRDRLQDVRVPILAVAGEHDQPTPPESLRVIADGVPNGRFEVVSDAAHLVPAEAPEVTAELLHGFLLAAAPAHPPLAD
ncbi:alpha/beta fold hydrolase [Brevibacterium jeotgali]|uniref:3-oxoadipate enol-lactonase n=1 Tax=Brevibacterium jeotgali TaxID=1262550 RepID=A0A2H1L5X2_9MICO|nr:alpha/beta hydrolase [Brevibacterium jeotgali]TWC01371.1 3-oxoadipate enol-lactonase [Brevibacterium jeotgali]SMY12150.1 3-oxoadipate enol-lactonase [Brevibacterium jeotgali]